MQFKKKLSMFNCVLTYLKKLLISLFTSCKLYKAFKLSILKQSKLLIISKKQGLSFPCLKNLYLHQTNCL